MIHCVQVEDIVARREAELASKFEGLWKEREMEKEQEVEEAKASCRAKAKVSLDTSYMTILIVYSIPPGMVTIKFQSESSSFKEN